MVAMLRAQDEELISLVAAPESDSRRFDEFGCVETKGWLEHCLPLQDEQLLSAGDVADGEIITIPLGTRTLFNTAVVAPEQVAPLMAETPSEVTSRSAAAVAAAASIQVLSARTDTTDLPPRKMPLSETSLIASSPPLAMGATNDSVGPVNPCSMPIFTSSSASARDENTVEIAVINISFFIMSSAICNLKQ
jgi:hypothetical protein